MQRIRVTLELPIEGTPSNSDVLLYANAVLTTVRNSWDGVALVEVTREDTYWPRIALPAPESTEEMLRNAG